MDENDAQASPVAPAAVPAEPAPSGALRTWIHEGPRAGFLLRPRLSGAPGPAVLLVLVVLTAALQVGLARLEVRGPANFYAAGWLGSWWTVAASVLLMWLLLAGLPAQAEPQRPRGLAAWFALWFMATVPLAVLMQVVYAFQVRELLPAAVTGSALYAWGVPLLAWGWMLAVALVLGRRFGLDGGRLATLAVALVAVHWIANTQNMGRPWYAVQSDEDDEPRLTLSQETFESQQALWQRAVGALARQRPGVRDVYGIVFAPYAGENVFLRESTMVAELLAQRFDAQGRVLQLANNPATTDRLPWATPLNLRRAIEAVAGRMDRENDVLVLYLTSHGARNASLAAAHWPLDVQAVSPAELRRALDEAGIRHRVIAISACFSGSWVAPLASDTTLVMTAADADHTSYGCGRRSELTFFGRAVFDEELRATHSFEQAFAQAVPKIREREVEAKKPDGFSNPQISVGTRMRPVLDELAGRLERTAQP